MKKSGKHLNSFELGKLGKNRARILQFQRKKTTYNESIAEHIGIIGGGANGVSVFNELISQIESQTDKKNYEVTLFEKDKNFGTGLAYGTNMDSHILNMPVDSMSAIPDEPNHFLNWLNNSNYCFENSEDGYANCSKRYVPRKIYGEYLKDIFSSALDKALSLGIQVNIENEEVTNIVELKSKVQIYFAHSRREYDQVVLCLGNHPPTFGFNLKGLPGYFHHAWPETHLVQGIPNDEDVYIVGTGLTAIDAFITLQEKGHIGKITMISRSGILPKVRPIYHNYKLFYLNPEFIKDIVCSSNSQVSFNQIVDLFKKEFLMAGAEISTGIDFSKWNCNAISILKEDIRKAETGRIEYFDVLKASDDIIGDLWNSLNIKEKEHFDSHYKTLWNVHAYPMPIKNARKILEALMSGQLSIKEGFESINYNQKQSCFSISVNSLCCGPKSSKEYQAKYVINATGQGLDVRNFQWKVIKNCIANGTVKPHSQGGIDVEFGSGAVRSFSGKLSNRIYAVGAITRGVHFYTNSIDSNVKSGKKTISALIGRSLKGSHNKIKY